ncbi:UBP45 hydrolase, partial [Polypterus senegalus]
MRIRRSQDLLRRVATEFRYRDTSTSRFTQVLFWFSQGCNQSDGQHSVKHFQAAHSEPHCIVISLSTWKVWCHECNEELSTHCNKKALAQMVDFLQKHSAKAPSGSSSKIIKIRGETESSDLIKGRISVSSTLVPVKGLSNLGNTCFFNAVMQDPLVVTLPSPEPLTSAMFLFLHSMKEAGKGPISPKILFNQMCQNLIKLDNLFYRAPRFKGYQQQDSQELLHYLLDAMRVEETKRIKAGILKAFNNPTEKTADDDTKRQVKAYGKEGVKMNFVDRIFVGELTNTIMCEECEHISTVKEAFIDLSLPIIEERVSKPVNMGRAAKTSKLNERDGEHLTSATDDTAYPTFAILPKNTKKHGSGRDKNNVGNTKKQEQKLSEGEGSATEHLQQNDESPPPQSKCNPSYSDQKMTINGSHSEISDGSNLDSSNDADSEASESESHSRQTVNNSCSDAVSSENYISVKSDSGHNKNKDLNHSDTFTTAVSKLSLNNMNETHSLIAIQKEQSDITLGSKDLVKEKPVVSQNPQTAFQSLSSTYVPCAKECSIQSCLYQFTSVELLMGNNKLLCENCTEKKQKHQKKTVTSDKKVDNVYTSARKQMLISALPPVVILHLKRFHQAGMTLRKVNRHVDFPLVLDLAPFCSASCKWGIHPPPPPPPHPPPEQQWIPPTPAPMDTVPPSEDSNSQDSVDFAPESRHNMFNQNNHNFGGQPDGFTMTPIPVNQFDYQHGAAAFGPPSSGFHPPYWQQGPTQNRRERPPAFRERQRSPIQMPVKQEPPPLDAVKRRTLPAWIREGLEKMERDKQKKLEKERMEKQRAEMAKDEKSKEVPEQEEDDGPRLPRKSKFVNKRVEIKSQIPESRSPSPAHEEQSEPEMTDEEREFQLMMLTKTILTEVLLEVTNEEIYNVAKDVHRKATKGGLGEYGSDDSEDDRSERGSESSDTDDEELRHRIRQKQDAFRRKEKELQLILERQQAEDEKQVDRINKEMKDHEKDQIVSLVKQEVKEREPESVSEKRKSRVDTELSEPKRPVKEKEWSGRSRSQTSSGSNSRSSSSESSSSSSSSSKSSSSSSSSSISSRSSSRSSSPRRKKKRSRSRSPSHRARQRSRSRSKSSRRHRRELSREKGRDRRKSSRNRSTERSRRRNHSRSRDQRSSRDQRRSRSKERVKESRSRSRDRRWNEERRRSSSRSRRKQKGSSKDRERRKERSRSNDRDKKKKDKEQEKKRERQKIKEKEKHEEKDYKSASQDDRTGSKTKRKREGELTDLRSESSNRISRQDSRSSKKTSMKNPKRDSDSESSGRSSPHSIEISKERRSKKSKRSRSQSTEKSHKSARLGACVTGIDPVEDSIRTAQLHKSFDPFLDKHIHYKACTLEDITEEAMETFDGVVASEVVEHVSNVESFIKCCHKILKPEASLFITTINKTKLSYVFGILVSENVLKLLPKGTHEWEKFISPVELERIMESNGFSVKSIKGMLYNPISGLWSWIDSTAINYAVHAVKEKVPPEPDYCRSEDKDQPEDRL